MRGITTLAAFLPSFCLLITELHCLCPEASVVNFLLKSYNTNGRPVSNFSKSVTVRINPAFHQLINLDERDEVMETSVWMRLSWHDDFLTWNETDFGGVTEVRIFPNEIWKPDISLLNQISNTHDDFKGIFPAVVSSDGSVEWLSQRIFKTVCSIDVAQFPWDTQNCKMSFLSWTYDINGIDLVPESYKGDILTFVPNGQWVLDEIPVTRDVRKYPCCTNPFVTVEYILILNRKPLYYVVNLVVPCIFITLVGIMVFCLPAESGEKVSLSVTVLLSATVFLLILSDALPAQSDVVPQAAQFFLAVIIFMSLSTICTVVVLNVHTRGRFGHRVPGPIRRLFLKRFEKIKTTNTIGQGVFGNAESEPKKSDINGRRRCSTRRKSLLPNTAARDLNGFNSDNRHSSTQSAEASSLDHTRNVCACSQAEPKKSDINGRRRCSTRRKSLLPNTAACDLNGFNSDNRHSSTQSAEASSLDQTRNVCACSQAEQSPYVIDVGRPHSQDFGDKNKIEYGLDSSQIQNNVAENQDIIEEEWMYLAFLLDNAFFVIFLLGIIIVSVVLLWSRAV